jgi:RsiW-degrading membrane proteinase PrsW (M82 family)
MPQNVWMSPDQPLPHRGWRWLRTLLIGLLLFIVTTLVMFLTGNTNLYPTVIMIGNFLIPVVFVAFLYDHQHISDLSPATIAASFCVGGVLGVLEASTLETLLLPVPSSPTRGLTLTSALLVGLIEEGCKIVAVIILARRMRHTSEMDGLLMGGAVGMGFAALESTGYAFTAFLAGHGQVEASIYVTVLRGLVAPFGHGIWTALLGAILFRESTPQRFRLTARVLLIYLFVSVLHGFWDGSPLAIYLILPLGIPISLSTITLCIIGVVSLFIIYRQSIRRQMRQIVSTTI